MGYKIVRNSEEKKKFKTINVKYLCKRKEYILLFLILLLQISVMFLYGSKKSGYFVDELWSYGLANSYYHPHIYSDGALNSWVTGDYFREYLEVSEEERFQYDSVVYNQKNDYHPPLFYLVLHTICSFFPDSFSKWYALIPNIFYFSLCAILLYKIGNILFNNSYQALIPVIAYGLCPGSISNVIFLRMYVLLTVWVLYTFYIHANWIKTEYVDLKGLIKLMIVSYLGFMSHYYFFIFAFFMSVCYVIFLTIRGRMKEVIPYSCAMAGSLLLVLITFPTAFIKLFFDFRGHEAVENLQNLDNLFSNLRRFYEIMAEGTLANCRIFLWIGIIIGVFWIIKQITLNKVKSVQFSIIVMAIFLNFIYVAFVSKIAPYHVDRYIFCVYPFMSLVLSYLFFDFLCGFKIPSVLCQWIIIILFSGLSLKGMSENRIQYLYYEMNQNIDLAREHSSDDCIYITGESYVVLANALELQNMRRVLVLPPENMELLPEIIDSTANEMIVCVNGAFNQDDIMQQFCQNTEFQSYEPLFDNLCRAYVVKK